MGPNGQYYPLDDRFANPNMTDDRFGGYDVSFQCHGCPHKSPSEQGRRDGRLVCTTASDCGFDEWDFSDEFGSGVRLEWHFKESS